MNIKSLAKYVINYCVESEKPISNLQLQKILYFIEGEFYNKRGYWLTEADFYAWPFGPVNKEVYDEYCVYGGGYIYEQEGSLVMDEDIAEVVDSIIRKYSDMTAAQLVKRSHQKDGAWQLSYDGNKNTKINRLYMQHEFRRN